MVNSCEAFVALMYGKKGCNSLNELRSEKALKNTPVRKLPLTHNSFMQHILRAQYQLLIWKNACVGMHDLPAPTAYGFYINDGQSLQPVMMTQSPAAPELMNELFCECPANACYADCVCLNNEQPCTAACTCEGTLFDADNLCNNYYTLFAVGNSEEG